MRKIVENDRPVSYAVQGQHFQTLIRVIQNISCMNILRFQYQFSQNKVFVFAIFPDDWAVCDAVQGQRGRGDSPGLSAHWLR